MFSFFIVIVVIATAVGIVIAVAITVVIFVVYIVCMKKYLMNVITSDSNKETVACGRQVLHGRLSGCIQLPSGHSHTPTAAHPHTLTHPQ